MCSGMKSDFLGNFFCQNLRATQQTDSVSPIEFEDDFFTIRKRKVSSTRWCYIDVGGLGVNHPKWYWNRGPKWWIFNHPQTRSVRQNLSESDRIIMQNCVLTEFWQNLIDSRRLDLSVFLPLQLGSLSSEPFLHFIFLLTAFSASELQKEAKVRFPRPHSAPCWAGSGHSGLFTFSGIREIH